MLFDVASLAQEQKYLEKVVCTGNYRGLAKVLVWHLLDGFGRDRWMVRLASWPLNKNIVSSGFGHESTPNSKCLYSILNELLTTFEGNGT